MVLHSVRLRPEASNATHRDLADPTWDHAGIHHAWTSGAERPSRTLPPHFEGRDCQSSEGRHARASSGPSTTGREYNDERPHEALGQVPPKQRYEPSLRIYTGKLSAPEYEDAEVRWASNGGGVSFRGKYLPWENCWPRQPVAFRQIDDGVHEVRYGSHCLGYFLERDKQPRLRPERPAVALAAGEADCGGSVYATEPPKPEPAAAVHGKEALGA